MVRIRSWAKLNKGGYVRSKASRLTLSSTARACCTPQMMGTRVRAIVC
jgi:hypothetical protein